MRIKAAFFISLGLLLAVGECAATPRDLDPEKIPDFNTGSWWNANGTKECVLGDPPGRFYNWYTHGRYPQEVKATGTNNDVTLTSWGDTPEAARLRYPVVQEFVQLKMEYFRTETACKVANGETQ